MRSSRSIARLLPLCFVTWIAACGDHGDSAGPVVVDASVSPSHEPDAASLADASTAPDATFPGSGEDAATPSTALDAGADGSTSNHADAAALDGALPHTSADAAVGDAGSTPPDVDESERDGGAVDAGSDGDTGDAGSDGDTGDAGSDGGREECEPGQRREGEPCGENKRGLAYRLCVHGLWDGPWLCQDPDVCRDGVSQAQRCGLNQRGTQATTCKLGQWVSEECQDPDQCADGQQRQRVCGLNGKGNESQSCSAGHWAGVCVDPDVCKNAATDVAACGLNNRGERQLLCQDGQWQAQACVDPDECKLFDERVVSCGVNGRGQGTERCWWGSWERVSCNDPDECSEGTERLSACGPNGRGSQPERCTEGKFVPSAPCSDVDVCHDSDERALACEHDLRPGEGTEVCSSGQWRAASCHVKVGHCAGDVTIDEGADAEFYATCTEIGGRLEVSTKVELPLLTQVHADFVVRAGESVLVPRLEHVGGSLRVIGASLLRAFDAPALQSVGGSVVLAPHDWQEFERFALPKLESVPGDLRLVNARYLTVLDLSALRLVSNNVYIGDECQLGLPMLSTLDGLAQLEHVGGSLVIEHNHSLSSLSGLRSLHHVGRDLSIVRNANLRDVNGLERLRQVPGSLRVGFSIDESCQFSYPSLSEPPGPRSLAGLANLELVGKDMTVADTQLADFSDLRSLHQVSGTLTLRKNQELRSITGFAALKTVGGLLLENNAYDSGGVVRLELPIEEVAGNLTVRDDYRSTQIAFPRLRHVAGTLALSNIPWSVTLAFPALEGAGALSIDIAGLSEMVGVFPVLRNIVGSIKLDLSLECKRFNDFPVLEALSGDLEIEGRGAQSFVGFDRLHTVGGEVSLHVPAVNTMTAFPRLQRALALRLSGRDPNVGGCNGGLERIRGFGALAELMELDVTCFPTLGCWTEDLITQVQRTSTPVLRVDGVGGCTRP